MARLRSLSSRVVDRLKVERDTVFWDRAVTGFGVRVYATGGKVYVAQARGPDGPKRVTVGRHGVIGAEQARRRAALIIARIKAGEEPVPEPLAAKLANGPTVADLAARYMKDHVAEHCKAKTERIFRSLLGRHVLPALGRVPIAAVGREQAMEFHEGLAALPTTANMAAKMLSHMFAMAEGWGLAPEGTNPWRFVARYPTGPRERFLTDKEFERLGAGPRRSRAWRRRRLGGRGGGATPADADRLPQGRNPHAEVGECRSGGWGAEARGREDGRADGVAGARGGAGSRRYSPGCGRSLGDRGQACGDAYAKARRCVAEAPGEGEAR